MRTLCAATATVGMLAAVPAGLVAVAAPQARAAVSPSDGLALTPPMGWNDWNTFGCDVSERLVKETADVIVTGGLKDTGYEYVNIDDCWMMPDRDPQGRLVPNPQTFPNGIKGVADYVHSKGLKLGIYESAGRNTCAPVPTQPGRYFPGSLDHERQDAASFAAWGVDLLKYDNCSNDSLPDQPRYRAMRDALRETGRPILYSLCNWGLADVATWGAGTGHTWRTSGDIFRTWDSILSNYRANLPLAAYAGPGGWNDPDMLQVGRGLSNTEDKAHFSVWAQMAAPLIAGNDLRNASPETLAILGNREVIAVDQDPLGKQGVRISSAGGMDVLAKPLADGDVSVLLFNTTDSAATVSTTAAKAGLPAAPSYVLKDLWEKSTSTTTGPISAQVPAHGVVMYRVSAAAPRVSLTAAGGGGAPLTQTGDLASGGFAADWGTSEGSGIARLTSVTAGPLVHQYAIAAGRVHGRDLDTRTGRWTGWAELPGGASGARDISAAVVDNVVHLQIAGWDGGLWTQRGDYNAGRFNPSWTQVGGTGNLTNLTSVASGTKVRLYGVADGHVYGQDLDTVTGRWSGWTEIPGGATGVRDVTAAVIGTTVHLQIVGGDGALWSQVGDYSAGRFNPAWTRAGGSGLNRVTSVPSGPRIHVYATVDGSVRSSALDTAAGAWSEWKEVPGSLTSVADLTASATN
ncbi:hypothetical protein [Streptomyces goshikiensis]|uniref:hypothetical protein n=1 Tax=Streptomyces goshikiensis TaxID=1942 RepID=UPI003650E861